MTKENESNLKMQGQIVRIIFHGSGSRARYVTSHDDYLKYEKNKHITF